MLTRQRQHFVGGVRLLDISTRFGHAGGGDFQVMWEDGERVFCRGSDGGRRSMLAVVPAAEHPSHAALDRLAHEYGLRDDLAAAGAVRPLELMRERGRTMLLLEDPGGEPLERLLRGPMEVERFLRLAVGITRALGKVHQRGLVHKEIKPANILVTGANGEVWLTGFGIASRLPRERQSPEPPEFIAGTLAYMAPEQTGRMNRSIDSRSDLYSLGVTFYQTLTGSLPFTASDPMEWVHCHIARKPVPPGERLNNVPPLVDAIIMKLLAKTADERYQTAAGVESDLRRCLADWDTLGRIDEFPLGQHDTSDRLLIPEKLYGRAGEIDALLASFDRVVATGAPEFVLVSGYSGIGKSSVVSELHKALVPPRGLFAAGKFDQYKRDIPYATLAQALRILVRQILVKSEAEVDIWRRALREAVEPNGQLIAGLVPEVEFIIGRQPPVPDLPPRDALNRFQLVFRRFLGVFATPGHPLALFLDDLQWLDAATLNLLEHLGTHPDVRHLLLVGAYRDNEVSGSHPLRRTLQAIRKAEGRVQEIVLAPLGVDDIGQLIADAMHCEPERVRPLAQLVQEKTGGNPFFGIQFFTGLAEEGLLTFDPGAAAWRWNLDRIRAKGIADNVVELMTGKVSRLPDPALRVLKALACLGTAARAGTLSKLSDAPEEEIHTALWEVIRSGLAFLRDGAYAFVHDRVQEAVYALIPDAERAATHLRIGRVLTSQTTPAEFEETIFETVNQLNRGATLIDSPSERVHVAAFNLTAGKRAKASTAFASALTYFTAGRMLLGPDGWALDHEMKFDLELHGAECEFLTGALATAEQRLAVLSEHAASLVDRAAVTCLQVALYTTLDRFDRAIEVGLAYLRHAGVEWSPDPTDEDVRNEYGRMQQLLAQRPLEQVLVSPLLSDADWRATLDVLADLMPPLQFIARNLHDLALLRMTNISLERGSSDGTCYAYARLMQVLGVRFADYDTPFRFGQLACDLVDQRGLDRFKARVHMCFGTYVTCWFQHLPASRVWIMRAFEEASASGDLTFTLYALKHLATNLLISGEPLREVESEIERGLAMARKAGFGLVIDAFVGELLMIRSLLGRTLDTIAPDDEGHEEGWFQLHLAQSPHLALPACWYWIYKLQGCFFAGDSVGGLAAAANAADLLWSSRSYIEVAEYHFYAALVRAAACDAAPANSRIRHLHALSEHHRQIIAWAGICPANFENRAALVGAEIARLEGHELDAQRLYEQAIRSAREHGFIQNEAISHELAGRFYAERDFQAIADLYLRNARSCYLRWGADGKVRQLDRLRPHLAAAEGHDPTATIGSPVPQLDVTSVVKASQAVSSEIVLPKLIERLMTIALENAGADRGVLILPGKDDHLIHAEAQATGDQVEVVLCQKPITGTTCPASLVRYVIRTHESVILDDASKPNLFSDDYFCDRQPRSIFCLPLIKQGQLTGLLYLENTLTLYAFPPDRTAILELLAAQAAISLENTRLYSDLEEREAKIRRLVDANIIGIFLWDSDGQIIEANDAFLLMVGYQREDLMAGRLRWTDLTPPEWRMRDEQLWTPELKVTATIRPYEKEYLRKDGSRVFVLVGAASFDASGTQGVSFVVDLTRRQRAEAQARESEQRYREVQMALAHANRLATMGQLTASIAHEVHQPIAAALANANAAQRWFAAQPPDLEAGQQALGRIVKNAIRAGDVIGRIRQLIEKAPPRMDGVDINEAIREVIELTRGEAVKAGVSEHTNLAEGLPLVHGDRVRLQQVIVNLIINAIEAMSGIAEAPRELLITTGQAEPGNVLVAVRDSGPGLAPEAPERLFEAFYTTKPSGLGLGLSICRSIIEAHGGRLWASANVPCGSIFHFRVPGHF
jgi:PAS domain S-box-containing protein